MKQQKIDSISFVKPNVARLVLWPTADELELPHLAEIISEAYGRNHGVVSGNGRSVHACDRPGVQIDDVVTSTPGWDRGKWWAVASFKRQADGSVVLSLIESHHPVSHEPMKIDVTFTRTSRSADEVPLHHSEMLQHVDFGACA